MEPVELSALIRCSCTLNGVAVVDFLLVRVCAKVETSLIETMICFTYMDYTYIKERQRGEAAEHLGPWNNRPRDSEKELVIIVKLILQSL